MIVLGGGQADPNIARLVRCLRTRGLSYLALRTGKGTPHRLMWRVDDEQLWIDGREIRPTAAFLRYDVFTPARDRRPESRKNASRWYYTMLSWVLAHEHVAFLNRRYGSRHGTKPYTLCLAKRLGLATPDTVITNDPNIFPCLHDDMWISKPVDGGEYTQALNHLLKTEGWSRTVAEAPTLLQQRVFGPDLRVYGIGGRWFAFEVTASEIDYRQSADVGIRMVEPPPDLIMPLAALMDHQGLDFGAADFKVCSGTGRHLFLEINSAPMFTAFDDVASGALGDAIIEWLLRPSDSRSSRARRDRST